MVSANFGRTSKKVCPGRNQTFQDINCISRKAKKIIYTKCDRRNFCSVKAISAELGGDPCPGVVKYIDVIYKCVRIVPYRQATTRPSLPAKKTTKNPSTAHEISSTHSIVDIEDEKIFDGKIMKPNETNTTAISGDRDHGFFHSILVKDSKTKQACEGTFLKLDCPRVKRLQILSANFGRTSKKVCPGRNQTFQDINCISKKAKKIIYGKCDRRIFCSVKAISAELGGDPCPGVVKYIDVIYKCVHIVPYRQATTRPSLPAKKTTKNPSTAHEISSTHSAVDIEDEKIFDGKIMKPNETNIKAISRDRDHGFFHSMLVLLVLLKDKPRHSLLSVMTGVAAGAVIILFTVLVCVCVDKRRQKNESGSFNDAKNVNTVELEKRELLERKKGSNSDTTKTDDQVDSAFCDEDLDRRVSNDYETNSDMAYLDAYLDEYNKNCTLTRPPAAQNDYQNSGSQRMTRRAHNDGSKGRSYDYNLNTDNSFTTFS